jgi:KDO2-lipid IV(A) lauroyltransferase
MSAIRRIGGVLGTIAYWGGGYRRRVGIKNLGLCFPEMPESEKQQIIKKHFQYLLTSVLEYGLVFYATRAKICEVVRLKNINYLYEYYRQRPIILVCPHFVGLDIGVMRLGLEGVIGCSMYSAQANDYISTKLKDARLRFIQGNCEIFSRSEGLRPIIRKLRETNGLFYYLPDQDVGERDSVYVPFFAHQTCATISALPKLVSLTNAVVVPMAVYRVDDHYEVEFHPAWTDYPSGDLEADIIKMNQYIESAVLHDLPQYFWLHKRFKTQPNMKRGDLYKQL